MNEPVDLTHNPKNAVTKAISRAAWGDKSAVCKVLSGVNKPDTPVEWRASHNPRHWNYWLREWCLYASRFADALNGSGVRLAETFAITRTAREAVLTLEDIDGRSGHDLTRLDYALIASNWGRAQGQLISSEWLQASWSSRRFLREYTGSKPVNYAVLDDDEVWRLPLIRECWPETLREGLQLLYRQKESLYEIMESAPQVPCHLDFWPNNVFVSGHEVIPVDWAFFGSGALGEDIGNFIPDAVFDGFVAGEDIAELEAVLVDAYLTGLHGASDIKWSVKRTIFASAVKYVWLGPLLLERASQQRYFAYGGDGITEKQAIEQYRSRGLALQRLCEWADHALHEHE